MDVSTDLPTNAGETTPPATVPPATVDQFRNLAQRNLLGAQAIKQALRLIGHIPDGRAWGHFLQVALLILGALYLISGIFFFFAYNWQDMHHFVKLGVIEVAIVTSAAFAHYLGLDRLSGKVALTFAALLVGVLLAVFGQVYQTGADSYLLFAWWAVLIAGWVGIGHFAPLWFILLGLINLTAVFYFEQVLPGSTYPIFEILFLINALALVILELVESRTEVKSKVRWFQRITALAAFIAITIPTLEYIFEWRDELLTMPRVAFFAPALYLIFLLLTRWIYRQSIPDLFVLTVAASSLIVVITSGVAQALDYDEVLMFFTLGFLVIVQVTLAVSWLRGVAAVWSDSSKSD